jgi:hypothetical protein
VRLLAMWLLPLSLALFAVLAGASPLWIVFALLYGSGNGVMTSVSGAVPAELYGAAHYGAGDAGQGGGPHRRRDAAGRQRLAAGAPGGAGRAFRACRDRVRARGAQRRFTAFSSSAFDIVERPLTPLSLASL